MYDWLAFSVLALVGAVLVAAVSARSRLAGLSRWIMAGYILRVVGSQLRHFVIVDYYGGLGDAISYFREGSAIADQIRSLDFSFIGGDPLGGRHFWGTRFIEVVSGFVQAVIGPSIRAEFLVFSCFSFAGLVLILLGFAEVHRPPFVKRVAMWLLLWPSLWFWPASIGKEAVVTLGLGLAFYGYVRLVRPRRWIALGLGVVLCALVRPHVIAMFALAGAMAYWLRTSRQWTPGRLVQAVVIGIAAAWLTVQALGQLGIADPDLEGVQEFMAYRSSLTERGGSQIETGGGLLVIPMGFVNVLFRPFPWEAHNAMALIAAVETLALWVLIFRWRKSIRLGAKHWRRSQVTRFALCFTVLYVSAIGMTFANLGIIARQRVLVFPFLFILVEGLSDLHLRSRRTQRARRPRLQPPEPTRPALADPRPR